MSKIGIIGDSVSGSRGYLHVMGRSVTKYEFEWITGSNLPTPKTVKQVGPHEWEGLPIVEKKEQP